MEPDCGLALADSFSLVTWQIKFTLYLDWITWLWLFLGATSSIFAERMLQTQLMVVYLLQCASFNSKFRTLFHGAACKWHFLCHYSYACFTFNFPEASLNPKQNTWDFPKDISNGIHPVYEQTWHHTYPNVCVKPVSLNLSALHLQCVDKHVLLIPGGIYSWYTCLGILNSRGLL